MRDFCFFSGIIIAFSLVGCDNSPQLVRTYHESVHEVPRQPDPVNADPHAFMNQMPDDEIHANLKMGSQDVPAQLAQSVVPAPILWTAPAEWLEKPGSGMRVVSFNSKNQNNPIETTVISLAGQAGGLPANVARWLQQLKVTAASPDEISKFILRQESVSTKGGMKVVVLNFTTWPGLDEAGSPSMIAAVLDRGDSQIFFKMTGTTEALRQNFTAFKSLIQSIDFTEGL